MTALHIASCYGYIEICELLLEFNANINCLSQNGNTPLHFSIVNGHIDVVKLLLNKKARLDIKNNFCVF